MKILSIYWEQFRRTSWWRHEMEPFSTLLALSAGNSPVPVNSPHKGQWRGTFDVFSDLRLNKQLSKQPWGWWFETPMWSLWRQCNDITSNPGDICFCSFKWHGMPYSTHICVVSRKWKYHSTVLLKKNWSYMDIISVVATAYASLRYYYFLLVLWNLWCHIHIARVTDINDILLGCDPLKLYDVRTNLSKMPTQQKSSSWNPFRGGTWWHDDVIKWKRFTRYWPFVRGIHWFPVYSPYIGQWRGVLMFSSIYVWMNDWVNNREAGDVRCHRAHYNVTAMLRPIADRTNPGFGQTARLGTRPSGDCPVRWANVILTVAWNRCERTKHWILITICNETKHA